MPPKAKKARQQMAAANARENKAAIDNQECPHTSGDVIKAKYDEALERIKCLES